MTLQTGQDSFEVIPGNCASLVLVEEIEYVGKVVDVLLVEVGFPFLSVMGVLVGRLLLLDVLRFDLRRQLGRLQGRGLWTLHLNFI